MKLTVREVLDKHFADVKFDRALCQRIINYTVRLMNRDADHSAFFGGVLMGVNPIRFYDNDRELWFDDVIQVDDDLLQYDFNHAEGIDPNHNVASDCFNHIPGYIAMRLFKENSIPMNVRHEAMVNAFMTLHIKYITSLLVRRFKYPARREVAEATFAALKYTFDIKRIGSWGALIRDRSEGIVAPNSIYHDFMMDRAESYEYWSRRIVTDTQTRIRELIKKYYDMYLTTLAQGSRIVSTSDIMLNSEGEMALKDRVNGYSTYLRYMHSTVQHPDNLIKAPLMAIIENAMHTMPPQMLTDSLLYMSRNVGQSRSKEITVMIDESLLYAFDYMQANRSSTQRNTDLADLIAKIRAKVMAPKSDDYRVLKIREVGEKIVKAATKSKHEGQIASTRTGIMLYLILRAMTKNFYTK